MEPSLDHWSTLFAVAAIQGIFLSVMLFLRHSKVNNLLAGLILSFSVLLLFYVAYWSRYLSYLPQGIGMVQGLVYLFGPLAYFYVKSSRKDFYFRFAHLIPFGLFLIFFFSWNFYPATIRPDMVLGQIIFQNLHLAIYTFFIFQFTWKNKGHFNGALKLFKWRKKVAFAFAGYTLSFLAYWVLVWTELLQLEYDYIISLASSIFIYFIGYHGFQKQEVLKMYENSRYDNTSLSPSASKAILEKVKKSMSEELLFLNSDLKLNDLAAHLELSPHQISQVVNELEEKNYTDFVNAYRVEAAKRLLTTTDDKIIHIAYDSGFNNKASFNNAFKKITGMSPSQYRSKQPTAVI